MPASAGVRVSAEQRKEQPVPPQPLHLQIYSAPHDFVGAVIDGSPTSEYLSAPHVEQPPGGSGSLVWSSAEVDVRLKAYHRGGRLVIELFLDPPPPPPGASLRPAG